MPETQWIRSSYSDGTGGNCVEWAPGLAFGGDLVPVRDSKDTGRVPLSFPSAAWSAFVEGVKRGRV
ncbi:DUF397 domain-containing protein [Streptomyces tubbatahanensis]|uniref:DUF397 domain-containing protein n=1 Tax=Streptomyces tubbatahanensis TaxID=2923272 RepID=A0ABY3XXC2_9ACTN|nr:DUF397 domain-containing protein [Streptomyces tubbatahanensis]UNS99062.1 DUF397 domain-containing protein [Streptomyces tubbatahanensis]